jgi:hypothetical protein
VRAVTLSGEARALRDALVSAEAVAALASLSAAFLLILSARSERRRVRITALVAALTAVLIVMLWQPFTPHSMGDYVDYVESKAAFVDYFGSPVRFQFLLGAGIVHLFFVAFGRTATSPVDAFAALGRSASVVFVLGLVALAAFRRFSTPVVRYVAIVLAAAPTLLLFGYHEFGYLPAVFIASAIPLALIGLDEDRGTLLVLAAAALGVGVALHGFGVFALAFLLVATLAFEWGDPGKLLTRVAQVAGGAAFGWLVWVPFYTIGLGWNLAADHSNDRMIRPLFHTHRHGHRWDYAVFSHIGLRDIFFQFLILGVFASAVLFLLPRSRLWSAVAVAAVPAILIVVFFWPGQGLGNDTDLLGSEFPAVYGVGWLASRSQRVSVILMSALAVGQLAMLYVVHGTEFVHARDF